jgi:hypothetical protein
MAGIVARMPSVLESLESVRFVLVPYYFCGAGHEYPHTIDDGFGRCEDQLQIRTTEEHIMCPGRIDQGA